MNCPLLVDMFYAYIALMGFVFPLMLGTLVHELRLYRQRNQGRKRGMVLHSSHARLWRRTPAGSYRPLNVSSLPARTWEALKYS